MKYVYWLKVYREDGTFSELWSDIHFSTMKAACKYGERIHRRFGHYYRVIKVEVLREFNFF